MRGKNSCIVPIHSNRTMLFIITLKSASMLMVLWQIAATKVVKHILESQNCSTARECILMSINVELMRE